MDGSSGQDRTPALHCTALHYCQKLCMHLCTCMFRLMIVAVAQNCARFLVKSCPFCANVVGLACLIDYRLSNLVAMCDLCVSSSNSKEAAVVWSGKTCRFRPPSRGKARALKSSGCIIVDYKSLYSSCYCSACREVIVLRAAIVLPPRIGTSSISIWRNKSWDLLEYYPRAAQEDCGEFRH